MKKRIKDLTEEELKGLEDKAYKFRDEKGLRGLVTKNHIIWFINGTIEIPQPHILDKQEHDYLRAVCKPYKVEYIKKTETSLGSQFIEIVVKSSIYCDLTEGWSLPYFKLNSMYKNMEVNKKYTIEDLELDKEWEE